MGTKGADCRLDRKCGHFPIAVPIVAMMCKNIFEVYLKALTWNSACVWSLAFAKTECTCVRSVKKVCGVQILQNVWSVQKVCILLFVIVKKYQLITY